MIKFLTKILISFLFFFISVNAEIVNEVNISGNKRISKDTIIVLGQIQINNDLTQNNLNQILFNFFYIFKFIFKNIQKSVY